MSGLLKALAGVLVVLSLAGADWQTVAASGDTGPLPLYLQQLQQFVSRDSEPETEIRIFAYTVQRGDSLSGIARRFGSDVDTLARLNGIRNRNLITAGQVIEILTVSGSVHAVREGETLRDIAALYGVDPGSILAVNPRGDEALLARGDRLIIPGGIPASEPAAPAMVSVAASRTTAPDFLWPLHGRLTSSFGWRQERFHYGIDLAVPLGTPFCAAAAGQVVFASYRGSYGLLVEVDHGGGWLTRYAHAGSLLVQSGAEVVAGQVLGYVGLTGNTTGPHLHFEVASNGERVNPVSVLP